jgi:Carboxypeptidase regulatory-like domain
MPVNRADFLGAKENFRGRLKKMIIGRFPGNRCLRGLRAGHARMFSILLMFAVLLGVSPAVAQTTSATLSGNVKDPSGASMLGVTISAINVDTGIVTKTKTDQLGRYTFQSLSAGNYRILAEMQNFKTTEISGITLTVYQKATVNIFLQVGVVSTRVEVSGAAPLVSSTSASISTVISGQQSVNLPLNARRVGALAILVPGTVTDNGGFANSALGSPFSETTYVASGLRDSSNNTLIDGVGSRNMTFGGFALQPTPDATKEFRIQTNVYDAAFGETAGSTINLLTKSGTNQVHGSVYEFVRNDKFDAVNYFAPNKPEYRRNQFGFSLGGPVRKDKVFWFGNYEALREIQGSSIASEVPVGAEKTGNFSSLLTGNTANLCGSGGPSALNFDTGQLFQPATESLLVCPPGSGLAGSTILVGKPVPGNVIASLDPAGARAVAAYPQPNRAGNPNYVDEESLVRNDTEIDARVDYIFRVRDQFFGRYLFGQSTSINPALGSSPFPGFGIRTYYRGQNQALGWTHTFTPNLLNVATFGFQRNWLQSNCEACPRAPGYMESFGIKNLVPVIPQSEGFPLFELNNFPAIGDSNNQPLTSPDMEEKYGSTLMWTHGHHSVAVGADIQFWQVLDMYTDGYAHGQLAYNGQYSGLAGEIPGVVGVSDLADLLQGYPDSATRQVGLLPFYQVGGGFWNFFGQDDLKITENFSVNIGLRWEYRRPSTDKNYNLLTFVPTGAKFSGPGNGILVTPSPNAQNNAFCTSSFYSYLHTSDGRCLIASAAQRTALGFTGRTQQSLLFPDYLDYAPRIGLSWRPLSSDKLIVHAGYGIFYDLPNFNQMHFGVIDPVHSPTGTYITAFGDPPPLTNGAPTNVENVFNEPGIPPLTQQDIGLFISPHSKTPRVQEWSVGFESQLSTNWSLGLDYVGNSATRLGDLHIFGNQPEPGLGALQPRRPYPDLGPFLYSSFDAISNYNSFQTKLTKRFSRGLTLLASYTFQKTLDDNEGDEGFVAGAGNFAPQDDNNLKANYGPSAFNAAQRFVVSYAYQLPLGSGMPFLNRGGVVNHIVGGWQFSGIVSLQSGFPFSALSPVDYSNTGSLNPFPDRVCNGNGGPKTIDKWFNTNCFTTTFLSQALNSGHPRFGDSGRNILIGPGLRNADLALLKNDQITQRIGLEFRAELFNAFNTPSFGAPGSTVGTPTYGVLTSSGDSREVQLAMKLLF